MSASETGPTDCRCFLFDHAENSETTCECGHELDEHDEHGECWALVGDGMGDGTVTPGEPTRG
jgi:hypothetical protein